MVSVVGVGVSSGPWYPGVGQVVHGMGSQARWSMIWGQVKWPMVWGVGTGGPWDGLDQGFRLGP